MDIQLGDRQFTDFMHKIDVSGDGNVSYAEFLKFMQDDQASEWPT